MLCIPGIKRLLVLNAGQPGDSMDESVAAFKAESPQHAILSKLDEAAKLGTALDATIRKPVDFCGAPPQGSAFPEDWESADAAKLVRQSMRSLGTSAFDPKTADLGYYFSQAGNGPSIKVQFDA